MWSAAPSSPSIGTPKSRAPHRKRHRKARGTDSGRAGRVDGAYSLVDAMGRTLFAAVIRRGWRPLVMGRLGGATVVASECCALDFLGARRSAKSSLASSSGRRDRRRSMFPSEPRRECSRCVFEFVYFARPDSRCSAGRSTARVVSSVSARAQAPAPTAESCSRSRFSPIRRRSATRKSRAFRTSGADPKSLCRPNVHHSRPKLVATPVKIKYNPVRDMLDGKRVVVVDDSLVRGNTSESLVEMMRAAGAREVHLRSARRRSPARVSTASTHRILKS